MAMDSPPEIPPYSALSHDDLARLAASLSGAGASRFREAEKLHLDAYNHLYLDRAEGEVFAAGERIVIRAQKDLMTGGPGGKPLFPQTDFKVEYLDQKTGEHVSDEFSFSVKAITTWKGFCKTVSRLVVSNFLRDTGIRASVDAIKLTASDIEDITRARLAEVPSKWLTAGEAGTAIVHYQSVFSGANEPFQLSEHLTANDNRLPETEAPRKPAGTRAGKNVPSGTDEFSLLCEHLLATIAARPRKETPAKPAGTRASKRKRKPQLSRENGELGAIR